MLERPFGEGTPFPTAADLWKALDFIERRGLSRRITTDWRESRAIADLQGLAAARALLPELENLDILWRQTRNRFRNDINQAAEANAAWRVAAGKIVADAILAENLKAKREIEDALDGLREWAMTDEELTELMR